jgi:hypothetical protein
MKTIQSVSVFLPLPASDKPETVVTTCTSQSAVLKDSPRYPNAPTVQTAVADMDTAVTDLQGDLTKIAKLHAELAVAEKSRDEKTLTVRIKHAAVATAVTTDANGDPEAAKKWVGKVKDRAKPVPITTTTTSPENPALRNIKRRPGAVEASCTPEPGATCYMFQMGTDPLHPETWPSPVTVTGHTHKLENQPMGQVLCCRIAVVRRGGVQSQWSPVMQITVR